MKTSEIVERIMSVCNDVFENHGVPIEEVLKASTAVTVVLMEHIDVESLTTPNYRLTLEELKVEE